MLPKYFTLVPVVLLLIVIPAWAEEIRGTVATVDLDKGTLILEGRGLRARGATLTFAVDKDTHILSGKQAIALSDLSPGVRARVIYEMRDGQRMALNISVHGIKKAAPAAPIAPAAPAVAPRPAADGETVTGTLIRVGVTDQEIIVIGPGPGGQKEVESTFGVPPDVPITKGDKKVRLEDLKEGEQVTVRPANRDGKIVAAAIGVGGAAPLPTAKQPTSRLERLRQILQMSDRILQKLGDSKR
jgi:hypothetical protein